MKVFNPGGVPVPVDDGVIVPAGEPADVEDGPRLRTAIDSRQIIYQGTEPLEPLVDPEPDPEPEVEPELPPPPPPEPKTRRGAAAQQDGE